MRLEHNNELYAVFVSSNTVKKGTEWFGETWLPLQASRMVYPQGKEFRAHKHILNPRLIKRTQEAFIVTSGRISVEVLNEDKKFLWKFELSAGDMILIYKGYHIIKVLEDCVAFELKAGQFDGYMSEEKEFEDVRT